MNLGHRLQLNIFRHSLFSEFLVKLTLQLQISFCKLDSALE